MSLKVRWRSIANSVARAFGITVAVLKSRDAQCLVGIVAALLLRLLLSPPIWQHGEAREGLVVQSIVREHQWILPFRTGELPSKPPLFHWLAAAPALVAGANDFTVRLPSVLGASVMALTVFLIGRAIGGRMTAWLAVGALLGTYEFWDSGTQARVDMVFSACIAASLGGFFFWYRDGNRFARAICYLACAGAVLAKGPAGLALPALVIGGFLVAERRLQCIATLWSWPLAGIVLFVDIGWYALAYHIGGNEFFGLHIWRENFDRFAGRGVFSRNNTSLSTVIWLADQTLPWNLALLWSFVRRVRGAREDWIGRFLHMWWIAIFAFFAVAARARAVYLLPLYPAIALLAARAMVRMIASLEKTAALRLREETSSTSIRTPSSAGIVKRFGVAIVLFDVTMLLINPSFWRDTTLRDARFAFIEKIAAVVSPDKPLFVASEFDNSDIFVVAYRLGRPIDRKSITCADRNDYFLLPHDPTDVTGAATQVLASSSMEKMVLVAVTSQDPSLTHNLDCKKAVPVRVRRRQGNGPIDR